VFKEKPNKFPHRETNCEVGWRFRVPEKKMQSWRSRPPWSTWRDDDLQSSKASSETEGAADDVAHSASKYRADWWQASCK
jgi:hypothetical protein